jgi:hypothetical protein
MSAREIVTNKKPEFRSSPLETDCDEGRHLSPVLITTLSTINYQLIKKLDRKTALK